jgi:SAM-dependent methyltransferase
LEAIAMDRANPTVLLDPRAGSRALPGSFSDPGAAFSIYLPALLEQWVPGLEGIEALLDDGALGAAAGYSCGAAAMAMARAYPASHFFGFDPDPAVVRRAQRRADEQGVSERTTFEVAEPESIPNHRYALIILLSGLAGARDPMGVAWRALTTLHPAGSLLIVEPRAMPAGGGSVSGPGSGLAQAGFRHVRLIDQTAFARVLEARR